MCNGYILIILILFQSAQRRIRGVLQNALQQGTVRRGGGDRRERGPNQYQNNQ